MNAQELETCLKMLRAYWPSDWDDTRRTVWADALLELSGDEALAALRDLGRSATYPTVAELLRLAGRKARSEGEAIVVGDAIFLPGSGWLGDKRPDPDGRKAIGPAVDRTRALKAIRAARSMVAVPVSEDQP